MQDNPEVFRFQSVDSTNSRLKEFMAHKELPEFSAIISSHQTAGRGQIGNGWESEKDKNLTFSIVLYPHFLKVQKQFRITQMVTTAITDVLKEYLPEVRIKWPNDLYAGDQKLAGILIENALSGPTITSTIIGIGLNVNQEVFQSNAPNPVSMQMLTGKTFDLDVLFLQIRQALIFRYIHWMEHGIRVIRKDYFKRLYRNQGFYPYRDENGEFLAKIENVADAGHMILLDTSGQRRSYAFKEVSFLIK